MPTDAAPRRSEAIRPLPYTDDELFAGGPPPTRTGSYLDEIAFPLGGIGAGCISINGRGQLVDWEIFNRPNKGYRPIYTFLSLYARAEGSEPVFRVLEGRLATPYQGSLSGPQSYDGFGFGPSVEHGAGLLRMAGCAFTGMFPAARIDLSDPGVPVTASILAWSPFIPLNDADSSLPVAIFEITLANPTARRVAATAAFGLQNAVGWPEIGRSINSWVEDAACRGIAMRTHRHRLDSPRFGSLALLTPDADVTWQLRFSETAWFAITESLVDDFGTTGVFAGPREPAESAEGAGDVAGLGIKFHLAPGERATRTFVLAWHTPLSEQYWQPGAVALPTYAGIRWADAVEVARYVAAHLPRLREETFRFRDAFFASTLPAHVLETVSANLTTLRAPTLLRRADGSLWGWEGCMSTAGCCPGSCTHVWSYAQALAYLFPALERGMREQEMHAGIRPEDGHMQFRLPLTGACDHIFDAAADGQMGEVLRVYREWRLCGDDGWLRRMWPATKGALEYAWTAWDVDRDGLLEAPHHNTLDIAFHGPETMCGSMYLAALRAGEAMARQVGDDEAARIYWQVAGAGGAASDRDLFNGEYYFQQVPEGCDAPYQFGDGCICDQLVGQWHAHMLGLGYLYDVEHVRRAIASVFRHNFRDDFYSHQNPHLAFALNDDRGLVICTWPRGGRPRHPALYAHQCFSGMEHEVASLLIYEGFVREGLTLARAVRERHDGRRRNPYNEFECGSHYVRGLSSYAYMLALSGFAYCAPTRTLTFAPVLSPDSFRCFFSVEGAWGMIGQAANAEGLRVIVEVLAGNLALERIATPRGVLEGQALRRTPAGYTGLLQAAP